MTKRITNEQEWLESRQRGVGSSDSPVLALGQVFETTKLDTYIAKKSKPEPQPDNVNFRRGHMYEPLAIALAEQKLGMKIHAPETDEERWNDFQVVDPDRPWLYADFDGLREDGWVVEVKSPMQRIADRIRAEGLKDYYQVQGQHLVHVASVGDLPYLGKLPDGCPGVCFVIYEPEKCDVQIYEVPRNDEMIGAILANAEHFWKNHVETDEPPIDSTPTHPVNVPKSKSEYEHVEGEAWDEAVKQYTLADEAAMAAKLRLDAAKAQIKAALEAAGLDKVITANGHKFSNAEQAGRKSFDKKMLKAEHPEIDLDRYEKQGSPFKSFRHYGPKDEARFGDDTLDGQLLTLKDELSLFVSRRIGDEDAVDIFDELRDRAELYLRMLNLEQEGIATGIDKAHKALVASLTS